MTARAVSLTIVAFLLGALSAGGVGVRVIREVRTTEDATSLPAENVAPAQDLDRGYQVTPTETLIAATALVPTSASVTGDDFTIIYDLISLAPDIAAGNSTAENANADPIYPRRWVIETVNGTVEGGPQEANSREARFSGGDPLTLADIQAVRIVEVLAPFPFSSHVTLSEAAPVVEVVPGVSVRLVNTSADESTGVVQVAIDADVDSLISVDVVGGAPGWSATTSGFGGDAGFMVAWTGGAMPPDVPIFVAGTTWVAIDGQYNVDLDGLR